LLQTTRLTKPSNMLQADSVLGQQVEGHCHHTMGRGQSKQQSRGGQIIVTFVTYRLVFCV
jgi:hypothetical protein